VKNLVVKKMSIWTEVSVFYKKK